MSDGGRTVAKSRPDQAALGLFAGATLIGGSNFVAVRISNRGLDPLWGAGSRFLLASVLLMLLARLLGVSRPSGRMLRDAAAYGLLTFACVYGLLYWGLLEVPAGVAAVVMAGAPLLTLLIAITVGMERLSPRPLVGGVVAICGTAVMLLQPQAQGFGVLPFLAVVGGTLAAATSVVVAKRLSAMHPAVLTAGGMAAGGAALLLASALRGEQWSTPETGEVWLAFAFLVSIGSVGLFLSFLYLVRRWTASATSYAFVLFPVVAVAVGALVADEPITTATVTGGVLVMFAVYLGALQRP